MTDLRSLAVAASESDREFWIVVAQVIPVLFIAFVFETRSDDFILSDQELRDMPSNHRAVYERCSAIYGTLVALSLVIGEVSALWGLVNDVEIEFSAGHVSSIMLGSLAIGGFALVVPFLVRQTGRIFGGTLSAPWIAVFVLSWHVVTFVIIRWLVWAYAN